METFKKSISFTRKLKQRAKYDIIVRGHSTGVQEEKLRFLLDTIKKHSIMLTEESCLGHKRKRGLNE